MTDIDPLVSRIVNLATQGIYQHGEYAKERPELSTGHTEVSPDGQTAIFYAETDEPDTDAERVKITVTRRTAQDVLVIPVTNFELLRVLDGHELAFAATDGTPVRIRLYNTDELLEAQRAAAEALGGPDPGMTRAQAVQLCRPLDVEAIARQRTAAQEELRRGR